MQKTKASIKKNYALSLVVNILTLIIPLITTPYISRTLGANNIGIYSYCLSIETYFVILGTLGIPTYAKREIASSRGNKVELNRTYSELITLQIILLILSSILYTLFTIVINTEYSLMFAMCGIGIIAAAFDVSWLFQGIEDFETIAKRGIIFKVLCVLLIFLLVRNESDLYLYAFALMATNLICNFWLFITAKKIIHFKIPSIKGILKHLKPAALLLLPSMITAVYAVIDKTMLGAITNNMSEVGYYEQSQKIVNVSLATVTALGAVLMPRLTALYSNGDIINFKKYINKGICVIIMLATPIAVICALVGNNLVPWFYGEGYDKIILLLKIFSPMYILMGISDLIGTQTLLALKKEGILIKVYLLSTIINLFLNTLLIPQFQSLGAATATLISELIKCISFIVISKKYINTSGLVKQFVKYTGIALISGIVILICRNNFLYAPTIMNTLILILIGFTLYGIISIIIKDYWALHIIQSVKRIWRKT